LNERIGTTDGAVDDGLVENLGWTFLLFGARAVGPAIRRLDKRFGFAGDASAVPISEGNVTGMAQAAKSSHAMREAVSNSGRGHEMFNGIDGADGWLGLQRAECIHFLPEAHRIAQLAFGNEPQPLMFFAQHEGAALLAHAFPITFEGRVADVLSLERKLSRLDGQMGADRQPH